MMIEIIQEKRVPSKRFTFDIAKHLYQYKEDKGRIYTYEYIDGQHFVMWIDKDGHPTLTEKYTFEDIQENLDLGDWIVLENLDK
jgi:predicted Ser/Thr protein kinase